MNRTRNPQDEKAALDKALDEFTNECRARLHEMTDRGKRGWDKKSLGEMIACDLLQDTRRAFFHDERTHLHDIANRAMMLWWQAWRIPKKGGEA